MTASNKLLRELLFWICKRITRHWLVNALVTWHSSYEIMTLFEKKISPLSFEIALISKIQKKSKSHRGYFYGDFWIGFLAEISSKTLISSLGESWQHFILACCGLWVTIVFWERLQLNNFVSRLTNLYKISWLEIKSADFIWRQIVSSSKLQTKVILLTL